MPLPDPAETPLVRIDDVLDVLPVSRSTAYELARRGELPVLRLGSRIFLKNRELRAMLGLDAS